MRSLLFLCLASSVCAQTPGDSYDADRDLFRDVETEPERERKRQRNRELAPVGGAVPLYEREVALDLLTEAAAGLFAATAVGLLGGSIGEAIDPGDDAAPLGGFHGPVFGAVPGSMVGATVGVWAGAQLFEKETHWGWTALGSGIGTVVGSGAMFGITAGLGDSDGAGSLAVGTFLLCQIGMAMLFTDAYAPDPDAPAP